MNKKNNTEQTLLGGLVLAVVCTLIALSIASLMLPAGNPPHHETTETAKTTEYKTTETSTEDTRLYAEKPWLDYPDKYRSIMRDGADIDYAWCYSGQEPWMWLDELDAPGNAFAEFVDEKKEALNWSGCSDLDRTIQRMYLNHLFAYGIDPRELRMTSMVTTGFDENGMFNNENPGSADGNGWYGYAVFMSDGTNIMFCYGYETADRDPFDADFESQLMTDFNHNPVRETWEGAIDIEDFEATHAVTPANVFSDLGGFRGGWVDYVQQHKPTYVAVEPNIPEDLIEFSYVFAVYEELVARPLEDAKRREERKRKEESGTTEYTYTPKQNSNSYPKKKDSHKDIDPDDQDVESYYQDYKDDFEDEDDAWDDLMDNPDEWDDYD